MFEVFFRTLPAPALSSRDAPSCRGGETHRRSARRCCHARVIRRKRKRANGERWVGGLLGDGGGMASYPCGAACGTRAESPPELGIGPVSSLFCGRRRSALFCPPPAHSMVEVSSLWGSGDICDVRRPSAPFFVGVGACVGGRHCTLRRADARLRQVDVGSGGCACWEWRAHLHAQRQVEQRFSVAERHVAQSCSTMLEQVVRRAARVESVEVGSAGWGSRRVWVSLGASTLVYPVAVR